MAESGSVRMTARLALGRTLREHRKAIGLSGTEAALRLGWSQAKISRIEAARVRAEVPDIEALADAYEVSARDRRLLRKLAEEAAGPDSEWRNSTGLGLSRRQQDFVSMEAAASVIQHYQTMLIPGPLQIPEYTQRVFATFGVADASKAIETRQARRSALLRPGGPIFQVVLTEAALRWNPGPPGLLGEQLVALADLSGLHSNFDLRVLPSDGLKHAFLAHPVAIYRFNDIDAPLALIETTTTDVRVTDPTDVDKLSKNLEIVIKDCLGDAEAVRFVRQLVDQVSDEG